MRRKIEDAEVRDEKIFVKARGLFGGSGVANIALKDEDIRKSAPFSTSLESAAFTIRKQRWAYLSTVKGRDEKEVKKEMKEDAKRLGVKMTYYVTVTLENGPTPKDSMALIKKVNEKKEFILDYKKLSDTEWNLTVADLLKTGKREDKSHLEWREDFAVALEAVGLSFKSLSFSDKPS